MIKKITASLLIVFCFYGTPAGAQLVLSEIMFNAPYSEYYEEFIELANISSVDTINLNGYSVGDQNEQDLLVDCGSGLLLPPGGFALILDPGYWVNSTVYDAIIGSEALILTIADNAFGDNGLLNSTPDTVILKDITGQVIAQYAYTTDNPAGYSEEKIRLYAGDTPDNWMNSAFFLGTPGTSNSVQPYETDAAMLFIQADPSPLPYGLPVTFSARLKNIGLQSTPSGEVVFAQSHPQELMPDSLLGTVSFPSLIPEDSTDLFLSITGLPPGPHRIYSWHTLQDDDPANDTTNAILPGGYPDKSLIINEFLARPFSGNCEWVELYNPGQASVNLLGFSYSDSDTTDKITLTEESVEIPADNFVLLAQNDGISSLPIPQGTTVIVLNNAWPILNNDGDTPNLFDGSGYIQDVVPYTGWEIPEGISLERVYAEHSSQDPLNWRQSQDPTGGTPGWTNSVDAPYDQLTSSGSLSFAPDPFDPDQHGYLQVTIILPQDATAATVIVFDLRGRRLQILFDDNAFGQVSLPPWDGRDAEGRRLIPGIYILYAEFRMADGHKVRVIKSPLILAGRL